MIENDKLMKHIEQHPYPLLFATISGAHLYGFPSPDSDYDLRGVHLLPLKQVVGLSTKSRQSIRKNNRNAQPRDVYRQSRRDSSRQKNRRGL